MKAGNYREMSVEELRDKLADLKRKMFEMRCQAVTEKLENCKAVINTRREIARVKTVMQEKKYTLEGSKFPRVKL